MRLTPIAMLLPRPSALALLSSVCVLFALATLTSGCTAPTMLPSILGQPVEPVEVKKQPRRPTYKPYRELTMEYNLKPPEKTNWPERLQQLPKDAADGIDWVKELDANLIHPKSGLDDKTEPEAVLDLIVEMVPKETPEFKASFPHKQHTQLLSCGNCHTDIFQMQAGADPITMEKILAGEFCGRCHGPVAFEPTTACARCHPAMPAS